jgi:hypothetical protein
VILGSSAVEVPSVGDGNPESPLPHDSAEYRRSTDATAATNTSHSNETYPVDVTAVSS